MMCLLRTTSQWTCKDIALKQVLIRKAIWLVHALAAFAAIRQRPASQRLRSIHMAEMRAISFVATLLIPIPIGHQITLVPAIGAMVVCCLIVPL
jgi:hypothetical protein